MQMSFDFIGIQQSDITNECVDRRFQFLIQQAILLGLTDLKLLSQVQLYHAEEVLKQKYIEGIHSIKTVETSND